MADSSYIDGIMDIASTAPSPAAIALPRAAILIAVLLTSISLTAAHAQTQVVFASVGGLTDV